MPTWEYQLVGKPQKTPRSEVVHWWGFHLDQLLSISAGYVAIFGIKPNIVDQVTTPLF